MLSVEERSDKLVEEIGVYFENIYQIPPLAARIYGLLMICPRTGHSFDELVEYTNSSKSSVSTNINLLLNTGNIEYFTKSGERKRYFRLSKSYLKISLEKYRDRVSTELNLLKKVEAFNKEFNQAKYKKHKDLGELYQNYLEAHYQNLESTLSKVKQLEKQIR